jgi:SAM-dependent MidA family methyltransferase
MNARASDTARSRSSALRAGIAAEIQREGPIPFSRYMELCLYHPQLGYYSRDAEQFGKAGDFYTASDVHAVFGRLLTRQFEEMWRVLGSPARLDLIELGPGRGLFARDVLDWTAQQFPALATALRYTAVEQSATLRHRLYERLAEPLVTGRARIVERFDEVGRAENAIIFANEFFDALPVDVLSTRGSSAEPQELRIGVDGNNFVEMWSPASAQNLEFLDRYGVMPDTRGRVEAAPIYRDVVAALAAAVERGFCVAIDYGYTRNELLAGRHRGTIAAFRRHAMSASPYEAPGEQDITTHVNFTALAEMARAAGFGPQPLVTQSQFLLGIGESTQFGDAFARNLRPQELAKIALQLKHLVTPAGMGETFHVLVLARGISARGLSGLSFCRR